MVLSCAVLPLFYLRFHFHGKTYPAEFKSNNSKWPFSQTSLSSLGLQTAGFKNFGTAVAF
jgi:hypothetical protein